MHVFVCLWGTTKVLSVILELSQKLLGSWNWNSDLLEYLLLDWKTCLKGWPATRGEEVKYQSLTTRRFTYLLLHLWSSKASEGPTGLNC